MWTLIPQKLMPPTRVARYCCQVLKEGGGAGRMITTGVRWAESTARSKRGEYESISRNISKRIIVNNDNDAERRWMEQCALQAKTVVNPIIDWTDADVWEYARAEHIGMNPLYQCGFNRVGCIGCPMAGRKGRLIELARYPTYEKAYKRAFDRMLTERHARGLPTKWESAEDVFHWYMEDGVLPGQIVMEET